MKRAICPHKKYRKVWDEVWKKWDTNSYLCQEIVTVHRSFDPKYFVGECPKCKNLVQVKETDART